jgi:hypothetical protein
VNDDPAQAEREPERVIVWTRDLDLGRTLRDQRADGIEPFHVLHA